MTDANGRSNADTFPRTSGTVVAATLLVSLGLMFQLCELTYARFSAGSLWFLSVIGASIWNMLDACLKAQAFDGAFRFWPLALIFAGCGILLAGRSSRSFRGR